MAEKQHVQNWLRFSARPGISRSASSFGTHSSNENHEASTNPCEQVWFAPLDDDVDLHISSLVNGDLYAAGELEQDTNVTPPLPEFIQPSPEEIEKLRNLVSRYVDLGSSNDARVVVAYGRAFVPEIPQDRPIIAKIPRGLLSDKSVLESHSGVYLSFGHDLDGFTLGLGSGKVLTELVLGREPSINLSPFGLPSKDD